MTTLPTPPGDLPPEQHFLGHLKLIETVICQTGRRTHFRPQEAEDFHGYVMEKLIEGNYARLQKFKGESSIETFLTVIIKRLLFDYRDHLWGKWRASAEAKRLGEVAERLQMLMVRDEYTFGEACNELRGKGMKLAESELEAIYAQLPPRIVRRFVGEEALAAEASGDPRPDEALEKKERAQNKRRVRAKLGEGLALLSEEDRFFLKQCMDFKIADIARIHGMDQKALYRRRDKILKKLRNWLEQHGVRGSDIDDILGP
jgi:RNA polymerase sigma factor (sigma-70 family)